MGHVDVGKHCEVVGAVDFDTVGTSCKGVAGGRFKQGSGTTSKRANSATVVVRVQGHPKVVTNFAKLVFEEVNLCGLYEKFLQTQDVKLPSSKQPPHIQY